MKPKFKKYLCIAMSKIQSLNKFNNSWYQPGASSIKRVLWYIVNACIINSWFPVSSIKIFFLQLFGASIGKGCVIKNNVNIKYPWFFKCGDYCWIGENVWIDNLTHVTLGNHVCISQGALLLTGNHNYKLETFDLMVGAIILEDGVWIGAKSIVCPDVTCKTHSVITVGSVITRPTEAFFIYSGNPAQKIKQRAIQ